MVKKMMVYNWKSWWRCLHKNNHFVIKFGISLLLVALAFRLLYSSSSSRSSHFSPLPDSNSLENSLLISDTSQENTIQIPPQENGRESTYGEGKCNLFIGDWVPNQDEPLYTNWTCNFIEDHQNCMMNGRPDDGYLYWRWNPRGCELPRLDPERFLDLMRNKTWGFIGDSISRNHVQSFLCLLSKVKFDKAAVIVAYAKRNSLNNWNNMHVEKAIEVYHDESYKFRRWVFPKHNFTVSVIWSPFLAEAVIFEDINGVSTSEIELQLDILDKNWTDPYKSLDYMIFSAGKWFIKSAIYYENNTILGCHYCPKRNFTELGFNFAYRKVTRNFFNYIIDSNHKGMIFYRTSTPDHFEGGEWFSGGTCKRKVPAKEGEFELNQLDNILREIELEEFEKASAKAYENGVNLKLLDVNPLSLMRPDGHPGPYRFFQPFGKDKNASVISDCLHWCLPGPIDSWNDILVEMVVNG
ncbi:hypothetical protein BUALT_Bualt10G0062800 [Buddleja alternifolia]|uniref:Trichome birefringence-like N-terminal domain-containing protein n=1 Tax=Buddleja alternifolia TaxID=168488 RepID=A0AAV6WXZ2_9LAMI|nr:hypothetical protein BUALT_Bualt10G0062800 [Buddleja alternifolia]